MTVRGYAYAGAPVDIPLLFEKILFECQFHHYSRQRKRTTQVKKLPLPCDTYHIFILDKEVMEVVPEKFRFPGGTSFVDRALKWEWAKQTAHARLRDGMASKKFCKQDCEVFHCPITVPAVMLLSLLCTRVLALLAFATLVPAASVNSIQGSAFTASSAWATLVANIAPLFIIVGGTRDKAYFRFMSGTSTERSRCLRKTLQGDLPRHQSRSRYMFLLTGNVQNGTYILQHV